MYLLEARMQINWDPWSEIISHYCTCMCNTRWLKRCPFEQSIASGQSLGNVLAVNIYSVLDIRYLLLVL